MTLTILYFGKTERLRRSNYSFNGGFVSKKILVNKCEKVVYIALVAGCGKACEIAENEYKKNLKKLKSLKSILKGLLNDSGVDFHYNGDQDCCVDSSINVCFKGVMSEALMLSSKQYCSVSNGAACTSKSYSPSYVLKAMGIPLKDIESSVRISWGPEINEKEFRDNVSKMIEIAKSLVV